MAVGLDAGPSQHVQRRSASPKVTPSRTARTSCVGAVAGAQAGEEAGAVRQAGGALAGEVGQEERAGARRRGRQGALDAGVVEPEQSAAPTRWRRCSRACRPAAASRRSSRRRRRPRRADRRPARSLWANAVPEVPRLTTTGPGLIAPTPMAAHMLSPPPALTGMPACWQAERLGSGRAQRADLRQRRDDRRAGCAPSPGRRPGGPGRRAGRRGFGRRSSRCRKRRRARRRTRRSARG